MCWEMKDKELLKEKLKVEVREGKEVWVVSKMKLCRGVWAKNKSAEGRRDLTLKIGERRHSVRDKGLQITGSVITRF